VVALGNSIGARKGGIVAQVVEILDFDDLERKKNELKGKIVFYNYPFISTNIKTFISYGDAVKYRSQGASRAAKYGAVGVLVRSMSHGENNYPHTGAMSYDSAYVFIPALALGLKDADWLSETLKKDKNIPVRIESYGKFEPDADGSNVVAELRGSEFPDTYITVGGHLDSWDIGEGAHDDGAGVVQTIQILQAFKKLNYKPKHSIRFVLFANEENGLRGGLAYADAAKVNKEKHLFALESDAGGFSPTGFSFSGSLAQGNKMRSWLPLLQPYGCMQIFDGGSGADIGPLQKAFNIPGAGLSPDSQRYFDLHHAENDVFENVNKRELLLGAINMANLIYLVDSYGLD